MVLIYVKSGEWMSSCSDEWSFVVDKEKYGRMITLKTTTLLEHLKIMVCEDYGVEPDPSDETTRGRRLRFRCFFGVVEKEDDENEVKY